LGERGGERESDVPPAPSFDAIAAAAGLDPLIEEDRAEAVRIWLGLPARGPPT
jgi:hypothetical protein